MSKTINFEMDLREGSENFNPLSTNDNFTKIDTQMQENRVGSVGLATELKSGKVHSLTRENINSNVIRFEATSDWNEGDSMVIDGVEVVVRTTNGNTLPNKSYVINSSVVGVLNGTIFTVLVSPKVPEASNEIMYDSAQTVEQAINGIKSDVSGINDNIDLIEDDIADIKDDITALGTGSWKTLGSTTFTPKGVGVQTQDEILFPSVPSTAKEVLLRAVRSGNIGGCVVCFKGFNVIANDLGGLTSLQMVYGNNNSVLVSYAKFTDLNPINVEAWYR